ncbi:MAG: hypothetical protein ACYCSO_04190 [Cuniculiplasma sp.]
MEVEQYLSNLSFSELRELAKKSGIKSIPRAYKKTDLVKYILENNSKETIQEWIKKEQKASDKRNENHKEKKGEKGEKGFPRHEYIVDLQKERVHRIVVEAVCKNLKEDLPKSAGVNFYDEMSDKLLKYLHEVFVEQLDDRDEKYFELRCANWLTYKMKEIAALRTRHTLPGTGELRLVGFDVDGLPYVVGEFIEQGVTVEKFNGAIESTKKVLETYGGRIGKKHKEAWLRLCFFVPEKYSNNLLEIIKQNKAVNESGVMRVKRGLLKADHHIKILAYKTEGKKFVDIL